MMCYVRGLVFSLFFSSHLPSASPDDVGLCAQIEVIRANVVGTLTLADVTNERGIHLTIYATGCIFHYDKDFPQDSGIGFKESDTPNFVGSYYSRTKARVLPG